MNTEKTIAFYTLGCKLNFAETSSISRMMSENNFRKVNFNSKADYYFINSCCVTESAEKKTRNIINRAIAQSPESVIIVSGCYAQLQLEKLSKTKGINMILGNSEKFRLMEHIDSFSSNQTVKIIPDEKIDAETFHPSFSIDERTRSFLKVQDGCDYKCSYCAVPNARGKSRNAFIDELLEQVIIISAKGIKEIILTGINIGDFGKSTGETFYQLIQELDKLDRIERYRISSIEPDLLSKEIILFISKARKFVPHFHIPLQSGSDNILRLMKRRYNTSKFSEKIGLIRSIIPNAAIGLDVITGFPGESEDEFLRSYEFINTLDISYLHVFTYSERPDTEAIKFDNKVSGEEKSRRSKLLHNLSGIKRKSFYESNLGQESKVLFESENHDGMIYGFTGNYIKTMTKFDQRLVNNIMEVSLNNIERSGLVSVDVINYPE